MEHIIEGTGAFVVHKMSNMTTIRSHDPAIPSDYRLSFITTASGSPDTRYTISSFGCHMTLDANTDVKEVSIYFEYNRETLVLDNAGLREFVFNMMKISDDLKGADASNVESVIYSIKNTRYIRVERFNIINRPKRSVLPHEITNQAKRSVFLYEGNILSMDRLKEVAKPLVLCSDCYISNHCSKCSFMWKFISPYNVDDDDRNWILFYMGINKIPGGVKVQLAEAGPDHTHEYSVSTISGEFDRSYQHKMFEEFVNSKRSIR